MTQLTLQNVADLFVPIADFPKKGILFWNVNDLTAHAKASALVMDELEARCVRWEQASGVQIDYIAGFDARGFIFGATVADRLGVGFLQIRKEGKLPPPTVAVSYEKEYGTDTLEINDTDLTSKVVVLMDDLLATGGTAAAGFELIEALGGNVAFFIAVTELPFLKGREKLKNHEVESLLTEIDGALKANVRYCIDAIITDAATGELLLIDRLSTPVGYAMPGGGIELGESMIDALTREVQEETGCIFSDYVFHDVLIGANRDPRGDQVSFVYKVTADIQHAQGEAGKTEMFPIQNKKEALPDADEFAFSDHAEVIMSIAS